jgi:hypothetical protein
MASLGESKPNVIITNSTGSILTRLIRTEDITAGVICFEGKDIVQETSMNNFAEHSSCYAAKCECFGKQ